MTRPPSKHSTRPQFIHNWPIADSLIGLTVLILSALALLETFNWPVAAATFPRIVAGSGIAFSLLFLIGTVVKTRSAAKQRIVTNYPDSNGSDTAEDADSDAARFDIEYVFASAGLKAWLVVLVWLLVFALTAFIFGVYGAGFLFSIFYLSRETNKRWLFIGLYAITVTFALWGIFSYFMNLPVPSGLVSSLF